MYPQVEDMSEIYAPTLPRLFAIVLFAIEYSAEAQPTTAGAVKGESRGIQGSGPCRHFQCSFK